MDLDFETDVALSAAEVFEMTFADARNEAEARVFLKRAISEVRVRHPDISEEALSFAVGVAFGRRFPLRNYRSPSEAPPA